ncbi:protein kinase [Micromonospora sp. B11E3]|uniref:serine/threonine-protein kinase n=1 Tax=Micromonospora sp. B11E3 TaxID=3153562 RepID=UPI00325D6926
MAKLHAGRLLARRYRLIDQIGTGGMSVIWRARDEVLDRVVALKVLAPSLAADPRFRDMVREEARSAAQLVHPHVTSVHDYGETVAPDGSTTSFVVMELLGGDELEYRLAEGPLPWAEAVGIGAQVAEALAAAHLLGIVHRDITPANVMMTPVGAKVLDFGIATHVGAPDEDGAFGTPAYVAPERLHGAPAQPATDIYSLGVLLYETLTGRVPYPADTWEQLGAALATGAPPPPLDVPGLPAEVARTCLRCLARDPRDRPTAQEVAGVLRDQLLPADPQAATMLAPTVTLPSIVGPPEPSPARVLPSPPPDDPGAGRPADPAPAARGAEPAPPGRPGGSRRRRLVPLVVTGAVLLAGAALLVPVLTREPAPPSGALPDRNPAVAASAAAPDALRSAPPTSPTATRAPDPTRPAPPPAATATRPALTSESLTAAADRVEQLIEDGVASGGIRADVGADLRDLLGQVTAASGPGELTLAVRRARDEIAQRQRQGGITTSYARRLDNAFKQLGAAGA